MPGAAPAIAGLASSRYERWWIDGRAARMTEDE